MNLLVTGGTGFVGSHLVPRLADAGHSVAVLARGTHRADLPGNVRLVPGDVVTGEGLDAAAMGANGVIHLVAVIRERGGYSFDRVNRGGTANVVAAMQRNGVRRLIHMSALGAGPDPQLRYTYSKWLGEEVVRASGLDATIFRPSLLFGRGSGFVKSLRDSAATPLIAAIPGSGKTRFQPIWVQDVVTCLLLALEWPRAVGQCYEIGGPAYLTYEEILDLVLRAAGLRRIKLHVPLLLVRLAVALMERILANPPATSAELAMLRRDNATALDAVPRHFGFPAASLQEKIAESL